PDRVGADLRDRHLGGIRCLRLQGGGGAGLVVLHVGDPGHPELGPATELDPEVESLAEDAEERHQEEHRSDSVPQVAPADDVEGASAREQVVAELGEAEHQTMPPSVCSRVGPVRLGSGMANCPRPRYVERRAPRCSGSIPDHLWPSPKNLVLARMLTTGWVNIMTTRRSITVARPRAKANALTPDSDRKYSTAAAIRLTKSEIRIVRRALAHPVSTAYRSGRPVRTSSRMRSK